MTDQRTLDRLIAHLRGQVAELRQLERRGAAPEEVAERKRLILRLQEHLAHAVRDWVAVDRPPRHPSRAAETLEPFRETPGAAGRHRAL
ncbi:MAG TPA: hypothetical protein VFH80_20620 [Solirubrobacteraceae bacterium]|nr:hypothetical protein [Solirubrobacteraceae bacterium]